MRRIAKLLLVAGAALAVSATSCLAQVAAPPVSALPGGASSLNETFDDWQVLCGSQSDKTLCTLSQTQSQKDSGQRVLDIRLNPADGEGVSNGLLALPFGLALAKGVSIQVDEEDAQAPLAFSTCLPSGCLVPFAFDKALVASLQSGAKVNLKASSIQGQEAAFTISLKGFAKALARASDLVKQ